MALTPDVQNEVLLEEEYTIGIYPSKTYYMNLDRFRIQGNTDDIESIPQAIYCALNTERSKYLAYSDNYGVEFEELYGKNQLSAQPQLKSGVRLITDWLKPGITSTPLVFLRMTRMKGKSFMLWQGLQ